MEKNFKVIAIVIAVCMMFTLTSCQFNKGEEEGAKTGETPTISYMLPSDPGYTFATGAWVFENWGKKNGVQFEITSPVRDSFAVKIAALFASNQLPDMVNYYNDSQSQFYKNYGSQFFIDLDRYIDKGKLPNLKKWLDKYPDIREMMDHPVDKKLYGFPLVYDVECFDITWSLRNDVLKKGGMDAENIETIDDLKAAFLKLKEVSGQKYIASSRNGFNYAVGMHARFFGTAIGMYYDNRLAGGTNKYIYGPATERYKYYIEFLNWMYKNEILHPNFATMEQQELYAGYADGKFLICLEQATMGPQLGGQDPDKYPDREETIIFPVKINGEFAKQPLLKHQNVGFRWPVTISKTSQYADECMKAMDWLYSEEGIMDTYFGQEGVHWQRDDSYMEGARADGRQSYVTDRMVKDGKMTKEQFEALPKGQDLGQLGSYWIMGVISTNNRFGLADKPKNIAEQYPHLLTIKNTIDYGIKNGYTTGRTDPIIDFSKEERELMASISTPLETYMSETTMKFISGNKPFSEWESFVKELEKLRYKELEKMYADKMQ